MSSNPHAVHDIKSCSSLSNPSWGSKYFNCMASSQRFFIFQVLLWKPCSTYHCITNKCVSIIRGAWLTTSVFLICSKHTGPFCGKNWTKYFDYEALFFKKNEDFVGFLVFVPIFVAGWMDKSGRLSRITTTPDVNLTMKLGIKWVPKI